MSGQPSFPNADPATTACDAAAPDVLPTEALDGCGGGEGPLAERRRAEEAAAARRASYDAETAEAMRLWVVLSRTYAAVQAHALDDIARHGLNLPEFGALEVLYHKGPLLVGDLQRTVLMSSGGMTCLLDRLQQRGLVVRRACPMDRRAVWVGLTGEGTRLLDEVFPAHAARIRSALAGLPAAERRPLAEALKQLGRYAAEAARTLGLSAAVGRAAAASAGTARTSRRGRRPVAPPPDQG
jgi:MarR family 2-MHQ and catechol resistance regulon transcriptional repressor